MLIGLISDVHSNSIALESVISKLTKLNVNLILHAGDIVGYNPYPDETIELFKKNKIVSILGNHDRALITGNTSDFNPYAAAAIEWTRNSVSKESLDYILGLKDTLSIEVESKRITMFHESPNGFNEYIFPDDATPDLLSYIKGNFLVLGHTHIPFIMDSERGIIMNPGSVGQPRDGNPDASFAIYNTVEREIELRRTEYDIEKVIEDMLAEHLPEVLAFRLRRGQ